MDECKPPVPGPPHAVHAAVRRRRAAPHLRATDKAVQVDPIKRTLKAPGTQRLKLKHDEPLSSYAFRFNLRRYKQMNVVGWCRLTPIKPTLKAPEVKRLKLKHDEPLSNFAFKFNLRRYSVADFEAGAYTRSR